MKFNHSSAAIGLAIFIAGCSGNDYIEHGNVARLSAPELMIQYGCPACHVIAHVPGAVGKVGPPLTALAQRSYLAGTLQNSPQDLVRWLEHPQRIHPGTAMPEMGVTPMDAERIAIFLESNQ